MPLTRKDIPVSTVFGLGRLRPAPGTWGSLPPVVLAGGLIAAGLGPVGNPIHYHLAMVAMLLFFAAGCVAEGERAEGFLCRKDPPDVVADEVAGQCIPLLFLPAWTMGSPVQIALTLTGAFLAFRLCDIVKLPPAGGLQRRAAGWGILLDDLVAGVQAMVLVQLVTRVLL
jgi:phosphatidylglycerophosphatase A